MHNTVRTTITIPEDLLQQAKIHAITHKTTLSGLIRQTLKEKVAKPRPKNKTKPKKTGSLLDLAGTLNLGGKPMPPRHKLYDDHIKQKMGF